MMEPAGKPRLVSIIVPTFNRAAPLRKAVQSVLDQTYPNLEVIVVDDGSTDATQQEQEQWASCEPRLRYVRQRNSGANVARNRGFALAQGEFIGFLDSDDLFRPEKIDRQVRVLNTREDADACVCQISIFDRTPGDTPYVWNRLDGPHPLLRYAASDVVWGTAAPLWRRSALCKVGPWAEDLPFHQDLEFHLRALILGVTFVLIPEVLEDYHHGEAGTISASPKKRSTGTLLQLEIYQKAQRLAMARGMNDQALAQAFAKTYVHLAHNLNRLGLLSDSARARKSYQKIDPVFVRRMLISAALALAKHRIAGIGIPSAPLRLALLIFDLAWRPWFRQHTLAETEGKAYSGPLRYEPS